MEHLFYRKQLEQGVDPDTLIRCLLSALKSAEEENERLKRRIKLENSVDSPWFTTGQPSQHGGDWQ